MDYFRKKRNQFEEANEKLQLGPRGLDNRNARSYGCNADFLRSREYSARVSERELRKDCVAKAEAK